MIVSLVHWEGWSFSLLVEVDETSRTWLNLSLVVAIHCTKLHWVYPMIMKCLLALPMAG